MKMMGLSERIYFWSWTLATYATALVGIIVLSIMLVAIPPIQDLDPGNTNQKKNLNQFTTFAFSTIDYVLRQIGGQHERIWNSNCS